MFLKNSKVHTWICCLLGAFLLAAGISMQDMETETSQEFMETSVMATIEESVDDSFMESESQGGTLSQQVYENEVTSSGAVAFSYEDFEENSLEEAEGTFEAEGDVRETSPAENEAEHLWDMTSETMEIPDVDSDQITDAGAGKNGTEGSGIQIYPWIGTILLLAGTILAGLYIALFRQKKPYLGPEAELGLLFFSLLGIWMTGFYQNTYSSVIYLWPMCIALLISARGIWGWFWAGLPVKWSGAHRIGLVVSSKKGKESWYIVVQVVCCMAAVVSAMVLFGVQQLQYIRIFPWMLCLVIVVLSLICLMGALRDVDHLTEQIHQMHQGSFVPVQEGIFSRYEEQLVDFNRQHEEAVQTAVTSERFRVDLIANVSHDLRTPLTAILGYGELLKKENLSEEGTKQLTELNRKAGYMRDLVDSLFELTKVSSGVIGCKKEQIDLIRLLEQTIGLFDDKLQERNLQIRRHYSVESLPVITDGARMHQVFANLIGNAIKYTLEHTRIHLEVKEEGDRCMVRLVNIASYEMDFQPEEIIQRFARGDKARTTKGSGLGLAIAQTYTESVGGSFAVSVDGEQFSAVVTLPKDSANIKN